MEHFHPAALRVAVEARIPHMLMDNPHGLSTDELAGMSGLDVKKLRKILRALAARHIFREGT